MKLSGWGRFPRVDCPLVSARDAEEAIAAIARSGNLIPRGNGRSYGDAALNPTATLSMLRMDRMLSFDKATGRVECEAGLLASDLLDLIVPHGWFLPVTPGTKFVTLGGMIATDVHGKNHHVAGSFGRYVRQLALALPNGEVVACGPEGNAELLAATCGGMGLTGVILSASFDLIPVETAYMREERLRAANLDEAMAQLEASNDTTYTVAWIDCQARGDALGRSLLFRAEHARRDDLPGDLRAKPLDLPVRPLRRVPIDLPSFALNRWTVRAFNELYFRRGRPGMRLVDYDSYFYPLDAIRDWNRIYGSRGFAQYQCVLPRQASRDGLRRLLNAIAASGRGSFLAVLKLFGADAGLLSFPAKGYTLALDFPVDTPALSLLIELDAIVADHGGRIYLAKDARMPAAMMRSGYPDLPRFQAIRNAVDPERKFRSLLSERLNL